MLLGWLLLGGVLPARPAAPGLSLPAPFLPAPAARPASAAPAATAREARHSLPAPAALSRGESRGTSAFTRPDGPRGLLPAAGGRLPARTLSIAGRPHTRPAHAGIRAVPSSPRAPPALG